MKIIKLIIINLIVLSCIVITIDYSIYKSFVNDCTKNLPQDVLKAHTMPAYRQCYNRVYSTNAIQSLKEYYHDGDWGYFRKTINENQNKPSIIIFGCSFTYGSFLNDEQTFSYKLSSQTGRPVYNRGVEAGGPQHMLYFLRDENFYKHIKTAPEFVIYTYITNHPKRLNTNMYPHPLWLCGYNLQYKLKKRELVIKQNLPDFVYQPFIIKKIYAFFDKINDKQTKENKEKTFKLMNTIFLESKELIKQHYPNAKFVVIDYNYEYDYEKNNYPELWNTLEKEGFIVLHTKDLIGREFTLDETAKDKFHPSEKVWDILVPVLIKKLNI